MGYVISKLKLYRSKKEKRMFLYSKYCHKESVVKNRILIELHHDKDVTDAILNSICDMLNADTSEMLEVYLAGKEAELSHYNEVSGRRRCNCIIIDTASDKFSEILATAEYIVSDGLLPEYFSKRSGQKYYIIWGSEPEKRIGTDIRLNIGTIADIQHNIIQADVVAFSNNTIRKNIEYYCSMEQIFTGKAVVCEYKLLGGYLFDGIKEGVFEKDYSRNKNRKWRIIDSRIVKEPVLLDKVYEIVDPEKDIICFSGKRFTGVISSCMFDNYLDKCAFVFTTGKSHRTYFEDFFLKFSNRIKRKIKQRDRERWFGGLETGEIVSLKHLICLGDVKSITTRGALSQIEVSAYSNYNLNEIDRIVFQLRDKLNESEYCADYSFHDNYLKISIDMSNIDLEGVIWDVKVYYRAGDREETLTLYIPDKVEKSLERGIIKNKIGSNIFFPYRSKYKQLAFMYRSSSWYDSYGVRMKEAIAYCAYTLFKPYLRRKRIWLVFEKFCETAQDNGFYFFKYCMEMLPSNEKKNIYYVIKQDSDDINKVNKYGKQVVRFMSIRHMIYILAANIVVGSDAKSHLYNWRPMPSYMSAVLKRKKIYFLQHGVLALKRVDKLFGKHGSNPMTYFATSSEYEKRIVNNYFGYNSQESPITGLARWDVLEDESTDENKLILVMPTWRSWLEGRTAETFKASDYYENYMKLFTNPKLEQILDKYDGRMVFYIHPKFRDYLGNFVIDSNRIEMVPFGSRPLNEIIRGCRMLITDYSSVCWDVYYLGKPVMFYQFDYDMYMQIHGSYMDMTTELFGQRCFNSDEVIRGIEANLKNNFKESESAAAMRKAYFKYIDNDNSRRTYEFLKEQGF